MKHMNTAVLVWLYSVPTRPFVNCMCVCVHVLFYKRNHVFHLYFFFSSADSFVYFFVRTEERNDERNTTINFQKQKFHSKFEEWKGDNDDDVWSEKNSFFRSLFWIFRYCCVLDVRFCSFLAEKVSSIILYKTASSKAHTQHILFNSSQILEFSFLLHWI